MVLYLTLPFSVNMWLGVLGCSVYAVRGGAHILFAVTQVPGKYQLKVEGFILVHSLRVQVHHGGDKMAAGMRSH